VRGAGADKNGENVFTWCTVHAAKCDGHSKLGPMNLPQRLHSRAFQTRVALRRNAYWKKVKVYTQSAVFTRPAMCIDTILLAVWFRVRVVVCLRYDTIRLTTLTCAQKLTSSQLNLPHGTEQKRIMKKLKPKNGDAHKKRSGREVCGVSPEAGRESMVGSKAAERSRKHRHDNCCDAISLMTWSWMFQWNDVYSRQTGRG